MTDEGKKAGAVGFSIAALLGGFGDDCLRMGSRMATSADDVAGLAARGARMAPAAGLADDAARALPGASLADDAAHGVRGARGARAAGLSDDAARAMRSAPALGDDALRGMSHADDVTSLPSPSRGYELEEAILDGLDLTMEIVDYTSSDWSDEELSDVDDVTFPTAVYLGRPGLFSLAPLSPMVDGTSLGAMGGADPLHALGLYGVSHAPVGILGVADDSGSALVAGSTTVPIPALLTRCALDRVPCVVLACTAAADAACAGELANLWSHAATEIHRTASWVGLTRDAAMAHLMKQTLSSMAGMPKTFTARLVDTDDGAAIVYVHAR